jgi:hypothetical protein
LLNIPIMAKDIPRRHERPHSLPASPMIAAIRLVARAAVNRQMRAARCPQFMRLQNASGARPRSASWLAAQKKFRASAKISNCRYIYVENKMNDT